MASVIYLSLALALVLPVSAKLGGDCRPSGNRTSFLVQTQADVDALYAGCTRLIGSMDIVCSSSDVITSFDVFNMLEEITGYLHIEGCSQVASLYGFNNLRVVRGQALYSTPADGGYAIFMVNNPLWTDLSGLARLSAISDGRVKISGSSQLCYLDKVNWQSILGDRWFRVLHLSGGSASFCQRTTIFQMLLTPSTHVQHLVLMWLLRGPQLRQLPGRVHVVVKP